MLIRLTIAVMMFIILIGISSCGNPGANEAGEQTNTRTSTPHQKTGEDESTSENEVPSHIAAAVSEIIRLEDEIAESPGDPDLKSNLMTVHEMYVHAIVNERSVEPSVLNRVLYSHYMRILQLDPGNEEAEAGLNGVRAWYETHAMTLPPEVDPLDFLPGHELSTEPEPTPDQEPETEGQD